MEPFGIVIVWCCGDDIAQRTHDDEEEVHGKARPYQQACLSEAPYLAHAIVDNVGNGKDDDATSDIDGTNGNLLGGEKIGCYQADTKKYAQQQKEHTHRRLFIVHCF